MIIDFHVHIFSPEVKANRDNYLSGDPMFKSLYSHPKAKLATVEDLIANMDEQEIDYSVIQNIQWSSDAYCRRSNDYLLESAARYPGRLRAFCALPLMSPESAVAEIERCAGSGARGMGEIRPARGLLKNASFWRPVVTALTTHRLMLLTHASEPVGHGYDGKGDLTPGVLYPFISQYPELKLVCAHWGGGLVFYALMPEVKKALANVYFDTAASPFLYQPGIYQLASCAVGPQKILFGSDYPLLAPRRLSTEIRSLELAENDKAMFLGENARCLLGD